MRKNNMAEMTITEQIAKIKNDVCDYACKYLEKTNENSDKQVATAVLQGYCHDCPLGRLHYD